MKERGDFTGRVPDSIAQIEETMEGMGARARSNPLSDETDETDDSGGGGSGMRIIGSTKATVQVGRPPQISVPVGAMTTIGGPEELANYARFNAARFGLDPDALEIDPDSVRVSGDEQDAA